MRNVNRVKAATAHLDPEIIVNEIKNVWLSSFLSMHLLQPGLVFSLGVS